MRRDCRTESSSTSFTPGQAGPVNRRAAGNFGSGLLSTADVITGESRLFFSPFSLSLLFFLSPAASVTERDCLCLHGNNREISHPFANRTECRRLEKNEDSGRFTVPISSESLIHARGRGSCQTSRFISSRIKL